MGRRQSEGDRRHLSAGRARRDVYVDAYPDQRLRGTVASVSPGTGAQFAILPPQNASGNWVKVVQRLPIRIEFDAGQDLARLRAGMSATVDIDTGRQRSLAGLFGLTATATANGRSAMSRRAAARRRRPARRALLTVCAMSATVMQALDTTIANVALPYMQGALSASLDQINWVLTSYIVAAAIMTAPVGWLADRFGRKKLFIICVAGFTVASLLCALAQNIEQMVLFRLLQGMFGAALVPLSQSVMLDTYPLEQRAQRDGDLGHGRDARADHGADARRLAHRAVFSWHWVFLINVPIGIVTVLGLLLFMDETKPQEHLRFDWFGFLALAVGIGSLQLMLDRGEQVGWFESPEIIVEAIVSVRRLLLLLRAFAHDARAVHPLRDLQGPQFRLAAASSWW